MKSQRHLLYPQARKRIAVKSAAVVTAAALVVVLGAQSAAADSPVEISGTVQSDSVELQLVPDCSSLKGKVLAYAVKNKINVCGLGGAAESKTLKGDLLVQPANYIYGTCGSSAISMRRSLLSSTSVTIQHGFQSTVGPMVFRNLSVSYTYGTVTAGYSDVSVMASAVHEQSRNRTVTRGAVHAALLGTATTAWGLICYLKGPTASLPKV